MNWKQFWDSQASRNSHPQDQVGRVKKGSTVQEEAIDAIIAHISELLHLQPSDQLLDLCCGNGVLTQPLAEKCKRVVGVDISPNQLALAEKSSAADNITYHLGDVALLDKDSSLLSMRPPRGFDKVNLYFSFQYFDSFQKGKEAITAILPFVKEDGAILLGDVPDRKHFHAFYPSLKSKIKYYLKSLSGKNDMGKFWSKKEMNKIAKALGVSISYLPQPSHLPYSDYRCDFLITKISK